MSPVSINSQSLTTILSLLAIDKDPQDEMYCHSLHQAAELLVTSAER